MLRTNTKVVNLYQDYHLKVSTFFRTTPFHRSRKFCAKKRNRRALAALTIIDTMAYTFHRTLEHPRNTVEREIR